MIGEIAQRVGVRGDDDLDQRQPFVLAERGEVGLAERLDVFAGYRRGANRWSDSNCRCDTEPGRD